MGLMFALHLTIPGCCVELTAAAGLSAVRKARPLTDDDAETLACMVAGGAADEVVEGAAPGISETICAGGEVDLVSSAPSFLDCSAAAACTPWTVEACGTGVGVDAVCPAGVMLMVDFNVFLVMCLPRIFSFLVSSASKAPLVVVVDLPNLTRLDASSTGNNVWCW